MSFWFADFSVYLAYIIIHGILYYKFPYTYIFAINLFFNNLFCDYYKFYKKLTPSYLRPGKLRKDNS